MLKTKSIALCFEYDLIVMRKGQLKYSYSLISRVPPRERARCSGLQMSEVTDVSAVEELISGQYSRRVCRLIKRVSHLQKLVQC